MQSISFTGVILAGGDSSRMGRDKAQITHRGKPLWRSSYDALASTCNDLLIAGRRPDLAAAKVPCFTDRLAGSALAGIETGLVHCKSEWITVLPCDLPYPSVSLLNRLQAACSTDVDAVVPRTRTGREPLVACYRKSALKPITCRLESGNPKILDLLDELNVCYLGEEDLPDGWRRAFTNINTPADLEQLLAPPPAISFFANSGTGKTTLIENLIRELMKNGWTVGALKHDAHNFEIDHEGKDSWRLARAGAAVTAISSSTKTAVISQHQSEQSLDEILLSFAGKVDIVLTEGFRQSRLHKIEIHRTELNRPLISQLQNVPGLVAVASDSPVDTEVPVFDLNEITELSTFIEKNFLK